MKRGIVNIAPWNCQGGVAMEVGNDYGKNHNAVVVCITLVLCDARCMNSWELSKPDVVRVVVAVEWY